MPRQQPRPSQIPIAELRTEDECDAYIKAVALALRKHSAERRGRPVSPITANMSAGFILSALRRKEQIRLANVNARAAEIAASDPNDEPATTVFVGQDGTVGISK